MHTYVSGVILSVLGLAKKCVNISTISMNKWYTFHHSNINEVLIRIRIQS